MMDFAQVISLARHPHVRFHSMAQVLAHYMPLINNSQVLCYVGANTGQEINTCRQYAGHIYAFEAMTHDSVWNILSAHADDQVTCVNCALCDREGMIYMWPASNNLESSSMFPPQTHLTEFTNVQFGMPIQVNAKRLDQFDFAPECDVIIMDVQGAELQVLAGISDWDQIKMIILEYVSAHMYASCCTFDQIYHKLTSHGFTYYESFDAYHNTNSNAYAGNAVFVKSELLGE